MRAESVVTHLRPIQCRTSKVPAIRFHLILHRLNLHKVIRLISKTTYDALKRKLTVSFRSGRSFEFHTVPARVAALLSQAENPLAYFERQVRGQYPWIELVHGRVVRNVVAPTDLPAIRFAPLAAAD
jgi:hypothetical protein